MSFNITRVSARGRRNREDFGRWNLGLTILLTIAIPPSLGDWAVAAIVTEAELDATAVNNTSATAQAILPADFTVDLNPNIFTAADGGLPGTAITASVVGHTGGFPSLDVDFYSFTMFSTGLAWFDIDGERTTDFDPDSFLAVFDSTGTFIAGSDDSFFDLNGDTVTEADPGSWEDFGYEGTADSFIGAIPLAAGTYYVAVSDFGVGGNYPTAISSGIGTGHDSNFFPAGFQWWGTVSGATFGDDTYDFSGNQFLFDDYVLHISQVVPEPSSLVLSVVGMLGLVMWRWRRKRSRLAME